MCILISNFVLKIIGENYLDLLEDKCFELFGIQRHTLKGSE